MKKEIKEKIKWAVIQKGFHYGEDDVFNTKREAEQYKKDCFEPEHKARIIRLNQLNL